jgi:hypothetical protein
MLGLATYQDFNINSGPISFILTNIFTSERKRRRDPQTIEAPSGGTVLVLGGNDHISPRIADILIKGQEWDSWIQIMTQVQ